MRRIGWTIVVVCAGAALAWVPETRAGEAMAKPYTNSLNMKLIRIEPGDFLMGQGDVPPKACADWTTRDSDETPAHKVRITKPFYLGATEVTNAQYELFIPEHRMFRGKKGASNADDEPVTYITWQQAVDFCRWLSKKEGKPYRLPTEAEWEYACRAGTTTQYHTGDHITAAQANFGALAASETGTTPFFSRKVMYIFGTFSSGTVWVIAKDGSRMRIGPVFMGQLSDQVE
jgi:formylglycine-generating enzyme required for sulfatase activity